MNEHAAAVLVLGVFLVLAGIIIQAIPYWRIFRKAGFEPLLSLLLFVPLVNLVMLYYLAFAEWPALQDRDEMSRKLH